MAEGASPASMDADARPSQTADSSPNDTASVSSPAVVPTEEPSSTDMKSSDQPSTAKEEASRPFIPPLNQDLDSAVERTLAHNNGNGDVNVTEENSSPTYAAASALGRSSTTAVEVDDTQAATQDAVVSTSRHPDPVHVLGLPLVQDCPEVPAESNGGDGAGPVGAEDAAALSWTPKDDEVDLFSGNSEMADQTEDTNLDWMSTGDIQTDEEPITNLQASSIAPLLDTTEVSSMPSTSIDVPDVTMKSANSAEASNRPSESVSGVSNSEYIDGAPRDLSLNPETDLQNVNSTAVDIIKETDAEGPDHGETMESSPKTLPSHVDGSSTSESGIPVATQTTTATDETLWAEQTTESMPWDVDDRPSEILKSGGVEVSALDQNIETSGFGFQESTESGTLDWAAELGLSDEPFLTDQDQSSTMQNVVDSNQQVEAKVDPEIEDSWSKAFGSPDSGELDDSWNAAFAEGFGDEDDLLLEESTRESGPSHPAPAATTYVPDTIRPAVQAAYSSSPRVLSSTYTAMPPISTISNAQQTPSTPMQFFEELPNAPIRSRRSRQPMQTQTPPTAPPMSQSRQALLPRTSSNPLQFRQPDRMDPFPPQPSVPVASTASAYTPGVSPPQPIPQATARYSPAPHVPPSFAVPPTAQPPAPVSSRYTTSQSNPLAPPASKSPYAPVPATQSIPGGSSAYARPPPSSSSANLPPRPVAPQAPTQGASAPTTDFQGPPSTSSSFPQSSTQATPPPQSSPPVPPPSNRFAPRTSSPLAQQDYRPSGDRSITATAQGQGPAAPAENIPQGRVRSMSPPAPPSVNSYFPASGPSVSRSPPIGNNAERTGTYSPAQVQPQQDFYASLPPPRRTQTSSPSVSSKNAPVPFPPAQSTSAQVASSAVTPSSGVQMPHTLPNNQSEAVDFVLPSDETSQDPLLRWKGAPIFHWGAGGVVVTCLPNHVPRYGGGQAAPKMKPLAGEVKLQRAKEVLSYEDQLPPFPGPLRSKSKKKEVVSWISAVIEILEKQSQIGYIAPTSDWTRSEEKAALLKVMKVLVEFDGNLSGNPAVEAAAREALKSNAPESQHSENPVVHPISSTASKNSDPAAIEDIKKHLLTGDREKAIWYAVDNQLWAHAMVLAPASGQDIWKQVVQEFVKKEVRSLDRDNQSVAALYQVLAGNWDESIDELVPLSARSGFQMISTAATPAQARDAFEGLNKWRETLTLILGNRSSEDENAILALGKLLASSGRIEAAHVCFLFAKSFAYFGGADDPQTVMSLVGVDHNNPQSNGGINLEAIQLSEVYEFALSLSPSATSSYVAHLQAYKLQHALSLAESGQRSEALLYCEAITSALKSTTKVSPYYNNTLMAQLDDLQRRLSQSPKDGASSWISRPTIGKVSSSMGTWFNSFVAGDDNDAASTGSGHQSETDNSPFARISGDTPIVSRSASSADLHANFHAHNTHLPSAGVSRYAPASYTPRPYPGEEATQGSFTPYSSSPEQRHATYSPRQSLDTPAQPYGSPPKAPSFARQPSQLSQYQSYSPQAPPQPSSSSGPRPSTSHEPYVPTVAEESPNTMYPMAGGESRPQDQKSSDEKSNGYSTTSNGYGFSAGGYEPTPTVNESQSSGYGTPSAGYDPPEGGFAPPNQYQPSQGGYEPPADGYEVSQGGYEPLTGGYEPPSGGYEPPSYQPYEPDESKTEPKKESIMDDDDGGFASQSDILKKQEKAARDKAAEEAFRAAAEADASRDKANKEKRSSSGWFGGFFGGKKDPNAPTVHKAKLGEESSFYFDAETKKWVNRKGGSTPSPGPSASAAAPPPPRASAPPSRNVSAANGPPPTSSPAMGLPAIGESSLKPPPSSFPVRNGPPSGPPSRSGTPGSTADSIVSETQPSQASAAPGSPTPPSASGSGPPSEAPSRPTTSMNNVSSIDDLIGAPQARKGGTIRKGKKGQRYIDVMAK